MEGSVQEDVFQPPSIPSNSIQQPDQSNNTANQSHSLVLYNENAAFQQASSNGRANAREGWQRENTEHFTPSGPSGE